MNLSAASDQTYMFDRKAECMPRADIAALQLARLKQTLAHAYAKVPHVRAKFDAAKVKPDDCKSLADIVRFPFATKADLRDTYPFDLFAVPLRDIVRIHASSGTTGKPTMVGYTTGDIDMWTGLHGALYAGAGATADDIIQNAYGYGLFTGGLGAHYGGERLGAAVVPISGGNTQKQLTLLQDFGATCSAATRLTRSYIAEVAREMGIDMAALPLRIGIFGAEPWSRRHAPRHPGQLDFRPSTSTDCRRSSDRVSRSSATRPKPACTLTRTTSWPRSSIPRHSNPLTDGELGELVITTLTKEALPLLRYRTRDITRLTASRASAAARTSRMIRVTGRDDDMLIIRGVNVFPSQIEAVLVGLPGIAPHYQLLLTREGALDSMTIEVEMAPGSPSDEVARAKSATEVAHQIKARIGVTCTVTVKSTGEVPRSQGKAVRVKDLRKKN